MKEDILFYLNDIQVILYCDLLNEMINFKQSTMKMPESGGVITGLIFNDEIRITSCSIPNEYDKQSRFNFIRSKFGAQKFINEKYFKSQGTEIYLGEWHTHPEKFPKPSMTDILSFKNTLESNILNSTIFFMLIVGLCEIYVGVYNRNKEVIKELSFPFSNSK